jgi:hypothetical protein
MSLRQMRSLGARSTRVEARGLARAVPVRTHTVRASASANANAKPAPIKDGLQRIVDEAQVGVS